MPWRLIISNIGQVTIATKIISNIIQYCNYLVNKTFSTRKNERVMWGGGGREQNYLPNTVTRNNHKHARLTSEHLHKQI
jgi:hypothetical protein